MPVDQIQANPDIRPIGPLDEAKDKPVLLELFASGLGVRDTARKSGLSQNQVSRAKKIWGLTSTPPPENRDPSAATEAFATKARRNRKARYDDYSEINALSRGKLLQVLRNEVKHKTILRGAMGMESQIEVDEIPARDLREWSNALVQLEVALVKIEDKEDDSGQTRALSMLEKFTEMATTLVSGGPVSLPEPRPGLIQE